MMQKAIISYTNTKKEDALNVDTNAAYERNRSATAQRYLGKVYYGNNKPVAGSMLLHEDLSYVEPEWHFEIVFNYGEYNLSFKDNTTPYEPVQEWNSRPDPFSTYEPGFEVRTYRRCEGVMLFHRFEESGKEPVLVQSSAYRYTALQGPNDFRKSVEGIAKT